MIINIIIVTITTITVTVTNNNELMKHDNRKKRTAKQFGKSILRFIHQSIGNYLCHGINVTTNERLSPTFRGNGNTIIVGDSQMSPLLIFPEGGGTSVHRLATNMTSLACFTIFI